MSNSKSPSGIGFVGLLTIAFIVLKLIGRITWPWFWVISPIWIGALLGIVVMVLMVLLNEDGT
jgi:hypothetical protein